VRFTAGTMGGMVVKTTKTSGYRSEGRDISEATLQTAPTKPKVSKAGPRRHVSKMETYEVGTQSEGGDFLVYSRDAHIYPLSR
jgi:hypothetical protein